MGAWKQQLAALLRTLPWSAAGGWLDRHPNLKLWLGVFRLGLFQFGLGLSLAPLTGTLNRVLIAEMQVPALAVSFLLALHFFVSPIRTIVGYRSDRDRAAGHWRTPYVVLGAMLTYGGLATAPFALILLSGEGFLPFWPAMLICTVIFLGYGIGVNIVETAFLAVVSDITPPRERARVLAVLWAMLVLGTVTSAVVVGQLLIDFSNIRLIRVLQGTAVTFVAFTALALAGQEALSPSGFLKGVTPTVLRLSFGESLRATLGAPLLRGTLLILFLAAAAWATHDVLLEPYGGEILGMPVSATTQLTALWGLAMLAAIVVAGWQLKIGRSPVVLLALGCVVGALGFALISLASEPSRSGLFFGGVALIGVGRGLFAVGSLALVMALASTISAGFLLGMWGVTQGIAQGIGSIASGLFRDMARQLTGSDVLGYTSVYTGALLLLLAVTALLFVVRPWRLLGHGPLQIDHLQDVPADQLAF